MTDLLQKSAVRSAVLALTLTSCEQPNAVVPSESLEPLVAASQASSRPSGMDVGFFYAPQRATGNWLFQPFESPQGFEGSPPSADVQTQFRRDLGVMAAMGARVIKIGYEASSDVPAQGLSFSGPLTFRPNGGASRNEENLTSSLEHLKQAIVAAHGMGFRVVVEFFMNSQTYLRGPNGFYPASNPTWFEYAYAAYGSAGEQRMADDLNWWFSRTLRELQNSGADAFVSSYSLLTEANYSDPRFQSLTSTVARTLLRAPNLPIAKIGLTAVPNAATLADNVNSMRADLFATQKWVGVTGIHSYPAVGVMPYESWAPSKALLESNFQGVPLEMGEFGVEYCDVGRDERRQAELLQAGLQTASALGFSRFFNWGLWDYGPNPANCGSKWGLGFSAESPRNAYGVMAEWASALRGGDFENEVFGWSSGSSGVNVKPLRVGPYRADSAVGNFYLRHTSNQPTSWLCSAPFAVSGNQLAVAGYIRSVGPLSIQVHSLTKAGWSFATGAPTPALALSDAPWAWRQIQTVVDGQTLPLSPDTSEVIVCFVSERDTSRYSTVLDVDALSASAFWR
jgi:hypothetical protein